uniref:Uncharacterized protein n=1 Tax=Anguilla anguilla TaxID=7936 RepID=A0A0E9U6Q2_ANGAN
MVCKGGTSDPLKNLRAHSIRDEPTAWRPPPGSGSCCWASEPLPRPPGKWGEDAGDWYNGLQRSVPVRTVKLTGKCVWLTDSSNLDGRIG